ncbi:MAG TPA: trypsin-like peptidase domain-containing protein [Vicinamibacterales bacterium]|nr:trypsin-like peptidase domain-containing protein [Vicinamibacterales bacterium]
MLNRKITLLYSLPIVLMSVLVGMIIASRLDISPPTSAQTVAAPPMNSAPLNGPITASTFRDIAKLASPAVVNIRTESRQRTQDLSDFFGGGGGDFFERFFGTPSPRGGAPGGGGQGGGQGRQAPQPREQVVQAAGTGFIIDKAGFILTNNHVVDGATKIAVSLYGEDEDQEYEARVVGRDPLTDSALIELTEKPNHTLPEIKFGDSSQMQPGDWVMAIGNPFGYAHTVSVGVISGLDRPFTVANRRQAQVLQTDAAINPGNSGGPLLNIRGEVIGMNTAIITDGQRQGNIGIGFAIPSNTVRDLLPQLRSGKITRGRIGVEIGQIPRNAVDEFGLKNREGALVSAVSPGGAADKAGMEPGDVIIAYNGRPVKNSNELVSAVTATRPGTSVPVRIVRDGKEQTINVTVDELDLEAEQGAQQSRSRGGRGGPEPETTAGFGLTLDNITPDIARQLRLESSRGAVVVDVDPNSPAARSGIGEGDVILRVGRLPVANAAEAQRELAKVPSGGTVGLRVLRDGQERFIPITKEQ